MSKRTEFVLSITNNQKQPQKNTLINQSKNRIKKNSQLLTLKNETKHNFSYSMITNKIKKEVIMVQTRIHPSLWNHFLKMASTWFTSKTNYTVAQYDNLIIDGLIWNKSRSRLLRMSIEAAKQGWCYKANAYIGELALQFGLDTYTLVRPLQIAMISFGYSDQEVNLLNNWIKMYRTGINEYILTNKDLSYN